MARYNTHKFIRVDSIQAYKLYRQHSVDGRHKSSIGHPYDNLVHNHLTWSLMASTRSYNSRWPYDVGRRRKGTNSKYQPRTDIQSIDNNCHARRPRPDVTITIIVDSFTIPTQVSGIENDVVWAFKALSEDNVHIRAIKLNH